VAPDWKGPTMTWWLAIALGIAAALIVLALVRGES